MERYLQIGKENLKHNLPIPMITAGVILCVSPLLMGIKNLSAVETAKVLDYFVVLISIILLPPIFLSEQNKDLRDLIRAKYTSQLSIYTIRIVQSLSIMLLYLLFFLIALRLGNCQGEYGKLFFGSWASMMFLGGLGIFAYSMTDQVVMGYMAPTIYYIFNYGSGEKYLKNFYLFSMMEGSYVQKWYLLIGGTLLLIAGILHRSYEKK